jgi:hypothetical protein
LHHVAGAGIEHLHDVGRVARAEGGHGRGALLRVLAFE